MLYPLRPQRERNGAEWRSHTHVGSVPTDCWPGPERLMAEHWTRCDCGCACIRKSAVTGNGCFEKRKRGKKNLEQSRKELRSKEATKAVQFLKKYMFMMLKCLFYDELLVLWTY